MEGDARHTTGKRWPQLDGVRAVAVLMVVVSHTAGSRFAMLGPHGVTLFFTLSAFLITGILRQGTTIRVFYARRFLRIFPAYYALLAVLLALNAPELRETWGWHAAYLSNWFLAVTGWWPPVVSHLWTLAIEEQFYLVWPWIVLRSRNLGPLCVGMVTVAVVSRWFLASVTHDPQRVVAPTFAAFDPLAIGALLAWSRPKSLRWALGVGLVMVVLAELVPYVPAITISRLGMALVSVWVIDMGASNRLPALFHWRPLRALGTISYGVYLWHAPIGWAVRHAVRDDPIARDVAAGSWAMLFVVLLASIAIATLSWFAVERPFIRLKPSSGPVGQELGQALLRDRVCDEVLRLRAGEVQ